MYYSVQQKKVANVTHTNVLFDACVKFLLKVKDGKCIFRDHKGHILLFFLLFFPSFYCLMDPFYIATYFNKRNCLLKTP